MWTQSDGGWALRKRTYDSLVTAGQHQRAPGPLPGDVRAAARERGAKFIVISSAVGSVTVGANLPFNIYAYGASKAAVNWVARKLHHDFPDFSECELPEA